jgi:hypothetical protein
MVTESLFQGGNRTNLFEIDDLAHDSLLHGLIPSCLSLSQSVAAFIQVMAAVTRNSLDCDIMLPSQLAQGLH